MAWYYIIGKQVGCEFWYFSVWNTTIVLNQVRVWLGLKLKTLFELVYNTKPDPNTWFEIFSIGYFNHSIDNKESLYKLQSNTLDGIAVGHNDKSNSIIFYNTPTLSYYIPPAFRLDKYRLMIIKSPKSLRFYGGLTCRQSRNTTDPIHELFPLGTHVSIQHNGYLVQDTINNIPLPVSTILQLSASPTSNDSDNISISSKNQTQRHITLLWTRASRWNRPTTT